MFLKLCKILGVLFNTFTADGKYSLFNKDNLMQPIQMQSSKTPKQISKFRCTFLKLRSYFEHFEKNDPHRLCISKTRD